MRTLVAIILVNVYLFLYTNKPYLKMTFDF